MRDTGALASESSVANDGVLTDSGIGDANNEPVEAEGAGGTAGAAGAAGATGAGTAEEAVDADAGAVAGEVWF